MTVAPASSPPGPSLPTPQKERWQPLRCGLLNLFRYDDEIFEFEDGHLLLRGSNGSGKSRVLALTLPFLLDGDLNPVRMEPDRDRAKRVEWNLLMGIHAERTGYSWVEFGRSTPEGPEYLTLGCGLHAVQGRSGVPHWFFLSPRRVGPDLALVSETGQVHNQKRLEEALAGEGEIYERAGQYRQAVDNRLFQLGEVRYRALLNLLIELRQPQLSRKLEVDKLSQALSEALSPLPEAVIDNVAEAFKSLDQDRDEVERLETAVASIDHFLKTYQRYLQVAARRRAEAVRTLHSRYEDLLRQLKEHREQEEAARSERQRAEQEAARLATDREATQTTLDTLAASPEMKQADEMEQARQEAGRCAAREEEAATVLQEATERRQRRAERVASATGEAGETRREVEGALQGATEAAAAAELAPVFRRTLQPLSLSPLPPDDGAGTVEGTVDGAAVEAARRRLDEALRELRRNLDHLKEQNRQLAAANQAVSRARQQLGELVEQRTDLEAEAEAAARQREREARLLLETVETWHRGLEALTLDPDLEGDDLLAHWCETGAGESPLERETRRARDHAVDALAEARGRLETRRAEEEDQRTAWQTLRDQLTAGYHAPPSPPPSRDPACRETGAGAAGAPLWQLIDFRPETDPAIRGRVEAALEAAGLLDALVLPDGRLLDAGTHDTVLSMAGEPQSVHLGSLLQPDPAAIRSEERAAALGPDLVAQLLERIGYGPDQGAVWVAASGRWRLGPLHGEWSKATAEHIGQSAREEARKRRLAEVEAELEASQERLDRLEEEGETLAARRRRIDREAGSLPDHGAVREAHARIAAIGEQLHRLRERLVQAERRLKGLREEEREARARRDDDAASLGLTAHVDHLDTLAGAAHTFEARLSALWPTLRNHHNRLAVLHQAQEDLREADADADRQAGALDERRKERAAAEARFQTLEATHGKTAEEVRRQYQAAKDRQGDLDARFEATRDAIVELRITLGKLEEAIGYLEERITAADGERGTAIEALRRFALERLLAEALTDFDADQPEAWSTTRAVLVARAIEGRLGDLDASDDAWRRLDSRIYGHLNELIDGLQPQGFEPYSEKVDDVVCVLVPLQGQPQTLSGLGAILETQMRDRREILTVKERAILEKHLIDEVAHEMHTQLRECENLVSRMNRQLASRKTSSGLALRFQWKLMPDDLPGLETARKILMTTAINWSPKDRQTLGRFLQERIQHARDTEEIGNWADHLHQALDYRRWHRFTFQISKDDHWRPLDRRSHGEKSGGEKVAALMLLQFAAATAHYQSAAAFAPRLILLDEAFVGVDDKMRGECMGLFRDFDLDFVMTSEREHGCYASLPGVAICQLSAHPGIDAVYVERLVWNGRERVGPSHG